MLKRLINSTSFNFCLQFWRKFTFKIRLYKLFSQLKLLRSKIKLIWFPKLLDFTLLNYYSIFLPFTKKSIPIFRQSTSVKSNRCFRNKIPTFLYKDSVNIFTFFTISLLLFHSDNLNFKFFNSIFRFLLR